MSFQVRVSSWLGGGSRQMWLEWLYAAALGVIAGLVIAAITNEEGISIETSISATNDPPSSSVPQHLSEVNDWFKRHKWLLANAGTAICVAVVPWHWKHFFPTSPEKYRKGELCMYVDVNKNQHKVKVLRSSEFDDDYEIEFVVGKNIKQTEGNRLRKIRNL